MTESRILITGATGKLGRQLVFELDRRGIKPIAHVRESSNTTYLDLHALEIRRADLRQETDLRSLVQGIDAIIHTAAYVDFRGDRLTQFTGINTFGAVNLFKAAQAAGVKRFVQVSTVAAVGAIHRKENGKKLGYPTPPLAREETEFNLDHLRIPYIQTKRAAEVELAKLAPLGTTELVTVCPSIVVAPSDTGDDRSKALKALKPFLVPYFPNRVNLVDIRDLAPGIVAALERGRTNERYILGGDDITGRELVLAVSSGDMPAVGSSKISNSGSLPRAIAISKMRLSPWERDPATSSRLSLRPTLSKMRRVSSTTSVCAGRNRVRLSFF